jgi:hypothetical protein
MFTRVGIGEHLLDIGSPHVFKFSLEYDTMKYRETYEDLQLNGQNKIFVFPDDINQNAPKYLPGIL